jgi:hypothetical protein
MRGLVASVVPAGGLPAQEQHRLFPEILTDPVRWHGLVIRGTIVSVAHQTVPAEDRLVAHRATDQRRARSGR